VTFAIGAESAQTRAPFLGSVDRGWRVEPFPSRVGTRARVPETVAETVATGVGEAVEDPGR
jgi:hypothetical protein